MRYQIVILALAQSLWAADVTGTVTVHRQLTKRSVTPTVGLYQRGVAAHPPPADQADPLDYERSHVVVYLESSSAAGHTSPNKAPVRPSAAVMKQENRHFQPDLLVVPAGAVVSFPNFDPIFHNVFSLSRPREFDLGNYAEGRSRTVTFSKEGIVSVFCHLHPNMSATIVVSPTPWAVISSANGQFRIEGVPPGKYVITAWHKAAGFFHFPLEVTERGAPPVEFVVPLPELPGPSAPSSQAHH
jgi:plastocyanin